MMGLFFQPSDLSFYWFKRFSPGGWCRVSSKLDPSNQALIQWADPFSPFSFIFYFIFFLLPMRVSGLFENRLTITWVKLGFSLGKWLQGEIASLNFYFLFEYWLLAYKNWRNVSGKNVDFSSFHLFFKVLGMVELTTGTTTSQVLGFHVIHVNKEMLS